MRHLVFCAVTGFTLFVFGCSENPATDNDAAKTKPSDIEEGDTPIGTEVTLKGAVSEVHDNHTFSLSDPGIDFEQDLIVVTKEPLPFTAEDGANVQVTGTVKQFSVVEVEKEYGWDFDPEVEIELEDVDYYLSNATLTVTDPANE